jgi:hypothetical protein
MLNPVIVRIIQIVGRLEKHNSAVPGFLLDAGMTGSILKACGRWGSSGFRVLS